MRTNRRKVVVNKKVVYKMEQVISQYNNTDNTDIKTNIRKMCQTKKNKNSKIKLTVKTRK